MKPTVVSRSSTVITLDFLPSDVQAGDAVQLASSTGSERGKRRRKPIPELLLLAVGCALLALWLLMNAEALISLRHLWLIGAGGVVLFLGGFVTGLFADE